MKLRRWMTVAAAVASFLGVTCLSGAAPALAQDAAPAYVALGDSYSSGLGAGDYGDSGDCKRSSKAYSQQWTAANSPASFDFTACSGAVTDDVLSDQLGPLNDSTGLVSISIGGNDAGFADTMQACVLQGESVCLEKIEEAKSYVTGTLPGKLDSVYNAISERAPAAKVVVMGYPHIYKLNGECSVGISEESRAAINSASDVLNDTIAKRAADHGFSFGDVRDAFSGHEICSGDSWLHSVTFPVGESYHPTEAGQTSGYLPVMEQNA
ncbi:SGNH/GDSL hydrolase family protein [Streptomyces winkii]|uniref:SGNH/GDSL hydrolase family protein n=1 Tax=Streptomyces winkii TaxID=3051178 RepID=UPI0028D850FC|nr:SGNH/GDSL hydrolase family protein [Streptomyces sp. DSM 40971]